MAAGDSFLTGTLRLGPRLGVGRLQAFIEIPCQVVKGARQVSWRGARLEPVARALLPPPRRPLASLRNRAIGNVEPSITKTVGGFAQEVWTLRASVHLHFSSR